MSVNGWFYRPYTFNDDEQRRLLTAAEVTCRPRTSRIGATRIPRDIVSIQNGFDLFESQAPHQRAVRLQGRMLVLDNTANIQCAQSNSCPGASKLDATLAEQAGNIATRNANPSSAAGFLRAASSGASASSLGR